MAKVNAQGWSEVLAHVCAMGGAGDLGLEPAKETRALFLRLLSQS